MSLTPTQLSELQTIVESLRTEFPDSDDDLWQAAIRIQKGGLGPVTGTGGQAAFDAAVADIVTCTEEISAYQGRQGGLGNSFDAAVFSVVPIEGELPAGSVGDVIYLDVAPNTYLATDVVSLTPAGPNSVILSEVGTQVARTVSAANGGLEVNNLNTGAGFERVLTTSDAGGGGTPGGANTSVQFNDGGAFGGFGTWDGSELEIPASQAAIILDETDGGGSTFLRLTSTTTADSGIQIEFDSSTGVDARIRQVTSGGTLQDIWIDFAEDAGVSLRFNNIRRFLTAASGVAALRSDGSTDAEARQLQLQHADGTQRASFGQETGIDLIIRNNIEDGEFQVFNENAFVAGQTLLMAGNSENGMRFFAYDNEQVLQCIDFGIEVRGNSDEDGDPTVANEDQNAIIQFANFSGAFIGSLGWEVTPDMIWRNQQRGGGFDTLMIDSSGLIRSMIDSDPDGITRIYNPASNEDVMNTTTAAAGGLLVDNQATGAGLERVLTTSDAGGGGTPGGADTNIQFNNAGAFGGSADFTWDDQRVTINAAGAGVTGALVFNTIDPAGAVLVMGGSGSASTNWDIFRSIDNGGTNFWRMVDDHSLSAGNHELRIEHSTLSLAHFTAVAGGDGYLFGETAARSISVVDVDTNPTDIRVGDQVTFRFDEKAAAGTPVANFGELWVRNDTPNVLIFTDDAGTDFVLNAGAAITGTPVDNQIAVFDSASSIEGDADFTWDGTTQRMNGILRFVERAASLGDVAGESQLWVRNTSDGELILTDDQGLDQNISESLYHNGAAKATGQLVGLNIIGNLYVNASGQSIYIGEKASANVDATGEGQLWVETRAFAQRLMFTPENGADIIVAGLPDSDLSAGTVVIAGTSFVAVANIGNVQDTAYMILANVEVTAPAADDMNIQMTVNSGSVFKGVLTASDGTISQIEASVGDVVTNNVLVTTDGSASPDGTYVSIQGVLIADGIAQTVSLRCGKNADTGADGSAVRAVIKALPVSNP